MPGLIIAKTFPTVLTYLRSRIGGISSNPDCLANGAYCNIIKQRYPEVFLEPDLAAPVRLKVQKGWPDSEWINAAFQVAIVYSIYDYFGQNQLKTEEVLVTCFEEMCKQPAYWVLMKVFSPSVIVLGTHHKWHYFFKGCELNGQHQKSSSLLTMTFPKDIFPELYCNMFRVVFLVIVKAAGAKNPTCKMVRWSPTEARYELTW